jgi:potassium-transporting ATPase KdpC subunit
MKAISIALRVAVLTLVVTGLVYPFAVTALGNAFFHDRARGSFIHGDKGQAIGSELIAQRFASPAYFQPRPSAAGDEGFDARSSSGSNLGPTSSKLRERVQREVARLLAENPDAKGPLPVELVTASASGLDPHLSPAGAIWQIPRIAESRGVSQERVRAIVSEYREGSDLGFLGEPVVNVLAMNIALDKSFGRPRLVAPVRSSTIASRSSTTAPER